MIRKEIEKILNDAAKKAGYGEVNLTISFSSLPEVCDFQCNGCFALAKKIGQNPIEMAENIVKNIKKTEDFEFFVVKAFINVKLTDSKLAKLGQAYFEDERGGLPKHQNSQFIVLDYGGANVAKALHVGHLRPAIIGESLKRLYKHMGDKVISDVHLGDWGLQMGLTELQLFEDGKLDGYFGKGKNKKLTLDDLNEAYPKASARKDKEEDFRLKAEEWTLKIQHKESPFYEIYQVIRELSVKEIKENYSRLGANFDLWYGESTADEYCPEAIKIISDKGLLKESEGALVVEVARDGENVPTTDKNGQVKYLNPMPPCLIQKSNGAALYATTDIATIFMRNNTYKNIDRIEYVTDARQKLHFNQVFRVCKMSGISPENQQLIHIVNGTMNGRDGKPFKTRSGDTIKLEDIISMLSTKAAEKLKANGVEGGEELALKIGVAAMKFGDLINNVAKDYVFDIDKFMAFEGKTGPYIQYTVVRINSILNKVDIPAGKIQIQTEEERNIIRAILKLNSAYEICYEEKSLNGLCLAVYDLASAFSSFYNNYNIINEKNPERKAGWIALLKLVKKKLVEALDVLAIEVPEKM